ncbi:2-dehydro-3-deoxygalactonokinase [Devosia nitrariae]|uniref:2-dehydro-3-deoxygalactonokinase n=1 Tax=Devosia nitrariae TaxID=2071872 RepID=A0ABQ5WE70_9HYPH|nr:2-dehydro-3-deoxygalactonokinase [Devosia nitrariae]GLQ57805.1 2-dehydro-3-deoxygalactonokinase [Devosia nitrariae]
MSTATSWIAVDWGTSNLRAWGVGLNGEVTFAASSDKGMGRLERDQFPAALTEVIEAGGSKANEPAEVLITGMAGARQGWMEAPYLDAPTDLRGLAAGAVSPTVPESALSVRILPGACQKTPCAENVMRGEETQLLGLSRLLPGFSGVVCMPGTHSKWAVLEGVRLEKFATAMTGELYEVLRQHSVLRHSLNGDVNGPGRADGFRAGLETGLARPDVLTGNLFTVRAASLLSGRQADWCGGYLSGLLIGSEVGGRRDWIGDEEVPLIGSPDLCALYAEAIASIGGRTRTIDATEATLAGLKAAREFDSQS